jgi:hypothetical protein
VVLGGVVERGVVVAVIVLRGEGIFRDGMAFNTAACDSHGLKQGQRLSSVLCAHRAAMKRVELQPHIRLKQTLHRLWLRRTSVSIVLYDV